LVYFLKIIIYQFLIRKNFIGLQPNSLQIYNFFSGNRHSEGKILRIDTQNCLNERNNNKKNSRNSWLYNNHVYLCSENLRWQGTGTTDTQNNLPIYVFNMDIVGNLKKVLDGEGIGTLVHN